MQPFKSQFPSVSGALFTFNAYGQKMFSLLDERGVHLMGQCCPIFLLKVKYDLSSI